MLCRLYKRDNDIVLNVNFKYRIASIDNSEVVLQNIKTNKEFKTDIETLDKHFSFAYCATCHSSQGASVDKSITIHEWDKTHLVSRAWLWTSITRCTDINKVKFYKSSDYSAELSETTLQKYLENKILNYKAQDIKAGRPIDENKYINARWLYERMNARCNMCGCNFEFNFKGGMLTSNLTAQRLNNADSHHKENCVAFCRYCNCSAK